MTSDSAAPAMAGFAEDISLPAAERVERIGNATLYLGDCRTLLPTLSRPDAIVSDPPYGQRLNTNITGKSVFRSQAGCGP